MCWIQQGEVKIGLESHHWKTPTTLLHGIDYCSWSSMLLKEVRWSQRGSSSAKPSRMCKRRNAGDTGHSSHLELHILMQKDYYIAFIISAPC